jgi:hypothetical protein
MALTQVVTIAGLEVTVKELTVREVREWATKVDLGLVAFDAVRHLALDDCSVDDILVMSDATAEDLDTLAPSEFAPLVEACRKLNPHFFRVRAAMAGAALVMEKQLRQVLSSEPA